jgi:quercetin dioxygenase-like cupin family protein
MKVAHYQQVELSPVEFEGAIQCRMRCLIGPDDGAPTFSMRLFEIASGGCTPHHSHPHEHEVFVLEGVGTVLEDQREYPLRAGICVFVPPNQIHQFRNTGVGPLKFLCLIPHVAPAPDGSCPTTCGCSG